MTSVSIRRVFLWTVGVAALAGVIATGVLEWRWRRRFEAPYPRLHASHDPAVIARGEYIVHSAAACAYCHVPRGQWDALDRGERLPLIGHHLFRLPFGDIYSANLTPDTETGIGEVSDAALARAMRLGVRSDGRAAFPLMEIHLADDDLIAALSYLRSRPPARHRVPEHRFSLLGKALMAFVLEPSDGEDVPRASPTGSTIERGAYLANHVSSCAGCHTDRGTDGTLVGPRFAGGQRLDVATDPAHVYVTPNLTPDAETSPLGRWTEDTFVARFRMGPQIEGTPMPWGAYARMTDDDLRALYRYFRSLPPTRHDVGPTLQSSALRAATHSSSANTPTVPSAGSLPRTRPAR